MKRFLSLFCAFAIIFSVSAAPAKLASRFEQPVKFEKKAELQKKTAKKQVKFAGKQIQNANVLNVVEAKQLANGRAIKKAPKAATEVIVSAIYKEYYASTLDVWYLLYNEDQSLVYAFDIILPEGQEDVELGTTYTLADMDPSYSTWGTELYVSYGYGTAYAEATFTKTVDAEGFVQIAATIVDENGDEFTLTYDEASAPKAPEGGEFEADEISVYHGDTLVQYVLTDSVDRLVFYFAFKIEEGAGDIESGKTYTFDDAIARYSGIAFNGTESFDFVSLSFVKTVADDLSYEIAAEGVDENGNTWKVTASKDAPKLSEETLQLNGTAEVGTYASYIEAADADTTVYVALTLWTDDLVGEWTEEDLYTYGSYVFFNEAWYVINKADFAVTFDEEASQFKVAGTLETENEDDDLDQIIFTLDLTLEGEAPEPASSEEVTFEMKDMTAAITEEYWDLKGTDTLTGYFLEIRSLAPQVAGTYTADDLDDYWTYVGTGSQTYFDIKEADVTVTFENNILAVVGTMTFVEASSKDTIFATLNVAGEFDPSHLEYDEKDDDFIVDFPTFDAYFDYIEEDGVVYVQATDENKNSITLEFPAEVGTEALAAGEYPIDLSGEVGTVGAGAGVVDGYIQGSFAGIRGTQGISNVWFLVSGTVTVTEEGNIVVDAVNSYDRAIKCTLSAAQGIENVVLTEKIQKVVVDGAVYVIRDNKMFNVLGTQVR